PEQALLLCGDGGEDDGEGWILDGRPGAGQLQQNAAAGSVVDCAVEDLVAFQGGINAEVIVMGGVEHGLIGVSCRTGQDADNVGGFVGAYGGFDVSFEADGEFDGFEPAFAGGLDLGIGAGPVRGGEEFVGDFVRDPG